MPNLVDEQYQNIVRDIDPADPESQRKVIDLANQLNAQVTALRHRVKELEDKVKQ